jgi:hypothetical protein
MKYQAHIKKYREGVWFPDAWLAFLAFGAPSTDPAVSLWTEREPKITTTLRKKRPINPSQVFETSTSSNSCSSKKMKEEVYPIKEEDVEDDIIRRIDTLKPKGPLVKPMKTFTNEVSRIA